MDDGIAIDEHGVYETHTEPEQPASFTPFEETLLGVVELSFLGDDGSVAFMDLLLKRQVYFKELPVLLAARKITPGFLEVLQAR
jgi:hypothetical protein